MKKRKSRAKWKAGLPVDDVEEAVAALNETGGLIVRGKFYAIGWAYSWPLWHIYREIKAGVVFWAERKED